MRINNWISFQTTSRSMAWVWGTIKDCLPPCPNQNHYGKILKTLPQADGNWNASVTARFHNSDYKTRERPRNFLRVILLSIYHDLLAYFSKSHLWHEWHRDKIARTSPQQCYSMLCRNWSGMKWVHSLFCCLCLSIHWKIHHDAELLLPTGTYSSTRKISTIITKILHSRHLSSIFKDEAIP